MLQDLEALAPPAIVCVAFLVGVGMLLRSQMAPRRRDREDGEGAPPGDDAGNDAGDDAGDDVGSGAGSGQRTSAEL